MLQNPRVTVAQLPLYYYIPNFGGIVLSAKQLKMIISLCVGIKESFLLYKKKATVYQMKKWQENFLWFFINKAFKKIGKLDDDKDVAKARKYFENLSKCGVLGSCPNEWNKLVCDIRKFISEPV